MSYLNYEFFDEFKALDNLCRDIYGESIDNKLGVTLYLEDMDKKSYCANPLTEAHFYGDRYAITNNTSVEQKTVFYDMNGKEQELILKPY